MSDPGSTPPTQCCTHSSLPPVDIASKPKVAKSRLSPSLPPPVILPVVAVGAQLTAKDAVTEPPEGTVTVCGLSPLTLQFAATPERATLCWPAAIPMKVTLPLIAIGWLFVSSTVTV